MATESVSGSNRMDEGISRSDDILSPHVVVGIPAYNEAIGIGSTVLASQRYADQVVVADDGSSDATAKIARLAGATIVRHETNQGKGAAIRSLIEHARSTECETLVLLDGDGQHLPDNIPAVANPILTENADLVIGSRYLEGDVEKETPIYRRLGQRVLDTLTKVSTGTKVTDSQSGFRALSMTAVDSLSLTTNGMSIESEMIDDAISKGLRIQEVPIDVRYDGIDGQTYNPIRHGIAVMTFMLQLIRDRHPLMFFSLPGGVFAVSGLLSVFWLINIYDQTGTLHLGIAFVSGLMTIIGILCVFCGFILNRISHMMVELRETP